MRTTRDVAALAVALAAAACTTVSAYADTDVAGSTLVASPVNLSSNPGTPGTVTATLRRGTGAAIPAAVVRLVSDGCTFAPASQQTDGDGVAVFTISACAAGVQGVGARVLAAATEIDVPAATRLNAFAAPAGAAGSVSAGTPLLAAVTVRVGQGRSPPFVGEVRFGSSDPEATLPPALTLTAADHGVAAAPGLVLRTPGRQAVTAQDARSGEVLTEEIYSVTGTSAAAGAGGAGLVLKLLPTTSVSGQPLALTVTATRADGSVDSGYAGTLHFLSNDATAALPLDVAMGAADGGSLALAVPAVLHTAGEAWIVVTDGVRVSPRAVTLVRPGPAVALQVDAPVAVAAGSPAPLRIVAVDAVGNRAAFAGTAHIVVADASATVPAAVPLLAAGGAPATAAVVLRTAGTQVVRVEDAAATLAAAQVAVAVVAAPAAGLALQLPASVQAGAPFAATVLAIDAFGNATPFRADALALESSDAAASLPPPPIALAATDLGGRAVTVTLFTTGTASLRLIDPRSTVRAQAQVTVLPAAAATLGLSIPAMVPFGRPVAARLVAYDAYQNVATDFVATAAVTSTDPGATLPGAVTLGPADAGQHAFTMTLPRPGLTQLQATAGGLVATASVHVLEVVSLTAGNGAACAAYRGLGCKCWGANVAGQLGLGDYVNRGLTPASMGTNLPVVALGSGRMPVAVSLALGAQPAQAHACALLDDASVRCWGDNAQGQLGLGDAVPRGHTAGQMGDALPPVSLGTGRSAVAVAAGVQSTCAILDEGSLKCWGLNFNGQLGYGDTAARGATAGSMGDGLPAVDLGAGRTALAVGSSGTWAGGWGVANLTCALLDDHSVKCWGSNGAGASAGTMGDALAPINLGPGRSAAGVAVGPYLVGIRRDDGTVTFGTGQPGPSGAVTTLDWGTGRQVTAVSIGGYLSAYAPQGPSWSCAVLDDASLKCSGSNEQGELGTEDTVDRTTAAQLGDALLPVALGTGRTALAVAAGGGGANGEFGGFTCALLDDQSIKCFGGNSFGQLGNGAADGHGGALHTMGDALPPVLAW